MQSDPDPQRVRELFDHAVDLPPATRSEYLKQASGGDDALRGEVQSLLDSHEGAQGFLADPTIRNDQIPAGDVFRPGDRIGEFTLLKVLGEGGYGVVYLAEQDRPLRRRVAVKVIRAGMDTRQVIARFELERQALAWLDHPNISKVLSAGATEAGRPYFVMEFVDGKPITEFCRHQRLDLDMRLKLFTDVCSAVEHAHRRGILHRDIKPGNVLVTMQDEKPVPKVIDFGIAKALHRDHESDLKAAITVEPQFLGTPQYMSPEQADPMSTHVDSRSDVYALGALLYELLADAPPFDPAIFEAAAYAQIGTILRETEVVPPSAQPHRSSSDGSAPLRVSGDLDQIALNALAKEPQYRYASAEALAADIGRYLRHEPVLARRPGLVYRLGKFAQRHRKGLIGALIAVACVGLGWTFALSSRHKTKNDAVAQPILLPGFLPGLQAEYFQDIHFLQLVTQRIDPDVHFLWHTGIAPAPGVRTPVYAVRWSGTILVPPGGVEAIGIRADDGARLWIDDQLVVEFHEPFKKFHRSVLPAGPHHLKLEYWNKEMMGTAELLWELPGKPETAVPAEALFHAAAPASQPAAGKS